MSATEEHEFYSAVYDILVTDGGADEDMRAGFLRYLCDGAGWHEWRFCGSLGFGGKFYSDGARQRVSCYPEDETPKRKAAIAIMQRKIDALVAAQTGKDGRL